MNRPREIDDPALDFARASLASDAFLDAPGPTVHLPRAIADEVLKGFGWQVLEDRFIAPDGVLYWERDEALQLALVAHAGDLMVAEGAM